MHVFFNRFFERIVRFVLFCRMVTGKEFQVNGPQYFKDCLVNSILQNPGNRLD